MTHPSDIAGLSERLRDAHPNSMQYINGSNILLDAATALDSLSARVKELEAENANAQKCLDSYADENQMLSDRATRAEQQRDEAYERAAKVAESFAESQHWPRSEKQQSALIAAAIRRLASGPEGGAKPQESKP